MLFYFRTNLKQSFKKNRIELKEVNIKRTIYMLAKIELTLYCEEEVPIILCL
jgi:hypothetical protein